MERKESAEETTEVFAYTPGLKIKQNTEIIKERRLPLKGELLVKVGDEVYYDQVVARAFTRGDPIVIDAASILKVQPFELKYYMMKTEGAELKEGDMIARFKAFFGFINRYIESPVEGTLESVSEITGQIVIREKPKPVEVNAYIPGKIIETIPNEGVIIKTTGVFIQGIFGLGGRSHGEIKILNNSLNKSITVDLISQEYKDKILVGSKQITFDAIKKAIDVGVSGIVVGGIEDEVLIKLLGEEIGVAITGEEDIDLTLIVTEGFGEIPMSKRTYSILKEFEGYTASINGATQIRAGVIRPEIIIPHKLKVADKSSEIQLSGGMVEGTTVRIIREPYFGEICKVINFPIELQEVDTGSLVRVLTVEFSDGRQITIPRANVEILEL